MARETEMKLGMRPDDRRRVAQLRVVRKYAVGKARRQHLRARYFDTPDLDLYDAGVALRVRREEGCWIQAAKTGGGGRAGLHQRTEAECVVSSAELDLERLPKKKGYAVLANPELQARLGAVFESDVRRTTWDLEFPEGQRVELVLDVGQVAAGERTAPIVEIELELKRGDPSQLYAIARELASQLDVQLEDVSKAERGYRLLRPAPTTFVKSTPVELRESMTAEEGFETILWNCLVQVRANEAAILESDHVEAVHQMRVGLRRFRACLVAFKGIVPGPAPAVPKARMKWLTEYLGPARDWDVFDEEHLCPMLEAAAQDHPVGPLRDEVARRRRANYYALREALRSPEYRRTILDLATWIGSRRWREAMEPGEQAALEQPLAPVARRTLTRGHKRIVARGKKVRALPIEELHRLRIEIKRQRYAAEFFASLHHRKQVAVYRGALIAAQDALGHLNDAAVAAELITELNAKTVSPVGRSFIAGWYAALSREGISKLDACWGRVRGQKQYWK